MAVFLKLVPETPPRVTLPVVSAGILFLGVGLVNKFDLQHLLSQNKLKDAMHDISRGQVHRSSILAIPGTTSILEVKRTTNYPPFLPPNQLLPMQLSDPVR